MQTKHCPLRKFLSFHRNQTNIDIHSVMVCEDRMKEQRNAQVELAKQRCMSVIDRIQDLPANTKITDSCRRTLLKLARSELTFLARFSSSATVSAPLRFVSILNQFSITYSVFWFFLCCPDN